MKEVGLGLLFKQLHIAFESNLQHLSAELELTPAQTDILIYLFDNEDHPINQRELEYHFHLSNPTVTGILKRMELKGYIERTSNIKDGRSKIILLTDRARGVRQVIIDTLDALEKKILTGFSVQEQEEFTYMLTKVLKNITE